MNNVLVWLVCKYNWDNFIIYNKDGSAYLRRYNLGKIFGVNVYLHNFLSSDEDRKIHDHPWYWSLGVVLTGFYFEEIFQYFTKKSYSVKIRKVRFFNYVSANKLHRICEVKPYTWTLFFYGKEIKTWGFLEGHTYIESSEHRELEAEKNK